MERPADQRTITRRYTEEAVAFIGRTRDEAVLPLPRPHACPTCRCSPRRSSRARAGAGSTATWSRSSTGAWARCWTTLRELKLDKNTLVIFSSDNGPWMIFDEQGGSAGPLRDARGAPGRAGCACPRSSGGRERSGRASHGHGRTLDLLPTLAALRARPSRRPGARRLRPRRRSCAGRDEPAAGRLLLPRDAPLRPASRAYKAHFFTRPEYGEGAEVAHDPPLVYDLDQDPGERYDVGSRYPEVVARIRSLATEHARTLAPVENQVDKRLP